MANSASCTGRRGDDVGRRVVAARRQDGRERERGRGRAYRRREEDEAHRCQSRAYPVAVASAFFGKLINSILCVS